MSSESLVLSVGTDHAKSIDGGDEHFYILDLEPNEFARVTVEQDGADVQVSLYGSDGQRLLRQDSPTGAAGKEELFFVAGISDQFRVRVESLDETGSSGDYVVRLTERVSANNNHVSLAYGAQALAEGYFLIEEGHVGAGGQQLDAAVLALEGAGEVLLLAEALRQRGEHHLSQDELVEARQGLERSHDLFTQAGDTKWAAVAGVSLGEALLREESYGAAILVLNQVVSAGIALPETEANARNNLGKAYRGLALFGDALNEYQQAEQIYRQLGSTQSLAVLLYNLGLLYESMGIPEDAETTYLEALSLAEGGQDPDLEVMILAALSNSERVQARFVDADQHLARAERVAQLQPQRVGQRRALMELYRGALHLSLAETQDADERLNELHLAQRSYLAALQMYSDQSNRQGQGLARSGLGRVLRRLGRTEEALAMHRRSHDDLVAVESGLHLPGSFYAQARLLREQGQIDLALEHAHWAWHMADLMRRGPIGDVTQSRLLDKRWHYPQLYVDLLMMDGAVEGPEDVFTGSLNALQFVERSRSQAFLDSVGEDRTPLRRMVAPELLENLTRTQRNFNAAELALLLDTWEGSDDREMLLERRTEAFNALWRARHKVVEASPGAMEIAEPAPMAVEEIVDLLDPQTVMLYYHLGEDAGYAWVVEPEEGGISSFPIPVGGGELQEAVTKFRNAVSGPKRYAEIARETGDQLTQWLLAPATERLRNYQRLAVVADGKLLELPFEVLPSPLHEGTAATQGHHPYLLERFSVVRLPSASALAALRHRYSQRTPAPFPLVMVADPDFGTGESGVQVAGARTRGAKASGAVTFDPLPHTDREATAILETLGEEERSKALVIKGRDATAEALLELDLGQYRVLHFATHGQMNSERPELSSLVLAVAPTQAGEALTHLRLHDLYGLNLNADLVVLSACRTGRGRTTSSEGLFGLPRGFMVAGAARVVYSLWNVGDESTADLMAEFYTQLKDHPEMDYDEALRQAQLSLLRDERWAAPVHWAAFQLGGEWRREVGAPPRHLDDDGSVGRQATGTTSPDPNPDGDLPIPGPKLLEGAARDSNNEETPDDGRGDQKAIVATAAAQRSRSRRKSRSQPASGSKGGDSGARLTPPVNTPLAKGDVASRERGPKVRISSLNDMPSPVAVPLGLAMAGGDTPVQLGVEELAQLALGTRRDLYLASIEQRLEERSQNPTRVDPSEGVEADDLSTSGWGVVFAPGTPAGVREALEDLVDRRRRQAGRRRSHYFRDDLEYKSGWTAAQFVRENGGSPYDPAEPEDLPYYLLLVGSPQEIPFRFQAELDHQYSVGRLYFEEEADYRAYADAVVAAEEGARTHMRRPEVALFGVDNGPGDWPSQRVAKLAADLATDLETCRFGRGWKVHRCLGADARRNALLDLLGPNSSRPAVVFAGGHGAYYNSGDAGQRQGQGALVTAEYQVEAGALRRAVEPNEVVAGRDFEQPDSAAGAIVFLETCYGLGTLAADDLEPFLKRSATAPEEFVARLPQRLLGRGGALAVVAHVNRTLVASFEGAGGRPIRGVFRDTLSRLLQGYPVGHALSVFAKRLAVTAGRLANLQDDEQRHVGRIDYGELGRLAITMRDASNFLVLGDPAVRSAIQPVEDG